MKRCQGYDVFIYYEFTHFTRSNKLLASEAHHIHILQVIFITKYNTYTYGGTFNSFSELSSSILWLGNDSIRWASSRNVSFQSSVVSCLFILKEMTLTKYKNAGKEAQLPNNRRAFQLFQGRKRNNLLYLARITTFHIIGLHQHGKFSRQNITYFISSGVKVFTNIMFNMV